MRVLVCGGRGYRNVGYLECQLDKLGITAIIEGGSTGADHLAYEWAIKRNVLAYTFQADWTKHGKAAGPIRNQQMLDEGKPELVVAFPGGRGTADMVHRAQRAGVKVVQPTGPCVPEK